MVKGRTVGSGAIATFKVRNIISTELPWLNKKHQLKLTKKIIAGLSTNNTYRITGRSIRINS